MKISIIAAVGGKERALGYKGKIPWYISEDFKRFKKITSGHTVIMGQKTFESIGKPLSNRTNIVISNDPEYKTDGATVVHSIEEALGVAKTVQQSIRHPELVSGSQEIPDQVRNDNNGEIFIIGGGQIYKQFLPLADRLYITEVEGDYEADTYFPDYSDFKIISEESSQSNGYKYKFLVLER